ncbi:MAG: N-acetylmuramic acid 6-phosphate etherase [Elusimicrobia bacterium GWA2_62_23]|nr:MAG: N-acetylmuramic acid 6-phosphate etherase [Elusimicrobia bacterium GWA2_62_23]OGR69074.1 MAG: N-acetylmuramic acid 6-phosphate etherase [Elusimicrobia bacterium GWC2_63_65]
MKKNDVFARYSRLPTEQNNPRTRDLDRVTLRRVLEKLNHEDTLVPRAVAAAIPQIEKAARAVSKSYLAGRRIFFIGAGTSGRLGVLEAAEIPPTYGVDPEVFTALMAGGDSAVFHSKEGAEDVFENGRKEIARLVRRGDAVVGIAASGITPYVQGGLAAGKRAGAVTILITCNPRERSKEAAIRVAMDVGPEPVSGSTRMKSGTATKLALNMLSTASMVISGKVYRNWMVDVKTTSKKLVLRAERITATVGEVTQQEARRLLDLTGNDVKTAIVMARLGVGRAEAEARIRKAGGFLKRILG